MMSNDYRHIIQLKQNNESSQWYFSSKFELLISYDRRNAHVLISLLSKTGTVKTINISVKNCFSEKETVKRNTQRSGNYILYFFRCFNIII